MGKLLLWVSRALNLLQVGSHWESASAFGIRRTSNLFKHWISRAKQNIPKRWRAASEARMDSNNSITQSMSSVFSTLTCPFQLQGMQNMNILSLKPGGRHKELLAVVAPGFKLGDDLRCSKGDIATK